MISSSGIKEAGCRLTALAFLNPVCAKSIGPFWGKGWGGGDTHDVFRDCTRQYESVKRKLIVNVKFF